MVRFGIIGFGAHAEKRYLPAFARVEEAALIAIQKRDREAVRQKQEEHGIPLGFTDPGELAACNEVDAVIVASPPGLHREHTLMAAAAGKHVLVEKPMAACAAECEEMIAACDRREVLLMVGFSMRFLESTRRMRELLQAGRIGRLRYVHMGFTVDGALSPRSWLWDPRLSGGGPVADLGAHLLDLIRFVGRESVEEVTGFVEPQFTGEQVERQAAVSLKLHSGALAQLFVSFELPRNKFMHFVGTEGQLYTSDFSEPGTQVSLTLCREGRKEEWEVGNGDPFARMVREFAEAIEHRTLPPVPGEEGLITQRLIDGIYRVKTRFNQNG
ncbi:MAG: gfo/Idh/MocA family oxidoreductase [Calditrichaeota bacterium]|nr:MAG: gfo/Idh/MocA family oxidoreductase [Calditrichota bacterium]